MNEMEIRQRLGNMLPITLDERGMVIIEDPSLLTVVAGGRPTPTNGNCPCINTTKGCGSKST